MAQDATKVHIATTGKIYTAPLATVAPADVYAVWPTGWVELGFTSEDGVKMKSSKKVEERRPWQSIYPVKRWVNERDFELTFTAWEWKGSALVLAAGGGAFATTGSAGTLNNTYNVPTDTSISETSLGVEWQDGGGNTARLIIPKGMVTSELDMSLTRKELIMLPITFSATATGTGATAYIMSSDPALTATG